jgi:hypothetical protein
LQRNAFNLNRDAERQLVDRNTAASGLVREVLLVHAVHLTEVLHVDEEDLLTEYIQSVNNAQARLMAFGGDMGVSKVEDGEAQRTFTLTTFSMEDPAALSTAMMFLQHCAVLSPMDPSISFPLGSAGIWPETNTWLFALMAWD